MNPTTTRNGPRFLKRMANSVCISVFPEMPYYSCHTLFLSSSYFLELILKNLDLFLPLMPTNRTHLRLMLHYCDLLLYRIGWKSYTVVDVFLTASFLTAFLWQSLTLIHERDQDQYRLWSVDMYIAPCKIMRCNYSFKPWLQLSFRPCQQRLIMKTHIHQLHINPGNS